MILIKDMATPDKCDDCFYRHGCNHKHFEIIRDKDGDFTAEYIKDDCPLIEVEPYGATGTLYKEVQNG